MGEFQVDGVTIKFRSCDHCGSMPTEADALKFIKRHESICDFCRHKIKVTVVELTFHRKDQHGQSWEGMCGTESHTFLTPDGPDRRKKLVHEECYQKMFPDGEGLRLAE